MGFDIFSGMAGLSMFGSVLSSLGQIEQGQSQKKAEAYNARIAGTNAKYAVASANDQANLIIYRGKRQTADMMEGFSAAGVRVDTGSPLSAEAESLYNVQRDASRTRLAGSVQAAADENQATLDNYYGKQAQTQSQMASFGTILGGAGNALSVGARGFASPLQFYLNQQIYGGANA